MRLRRRSIAVGGLVLATALFACSSPTELCACSDPAPSRVLEGVVLDDTGAPVPGATLSWRDLALGPEAATGRDPVTASSSGEYTMNVFSLTGAERMEVEVRIVGPSSADTVAVRLDLTAGFGLPPLARDFVLPS